MKSFLEILEKPQIEKVMESGDVAKHKYSSEDERISSEIVDEFMRSQNTIFEMMRDRGYDVESTERVSAFDPESEDEVVLVFNSEDKPTTAVVWTAPNSGVVGIAAVQKLAERPETELIFIVPAIVSSRPNISSAAKSALSLIDKRIQLYSIRTLLINPTKHVRVPKHTLLSEDEVREIEKTYGPREKFNRICVTDAIVRYYGWKRGRVVKITRPGNRIVYRLIT